MWNSKPVVAVFGSSQTIETDIEYEEARLLGRLLAREGYVVCNGGYGGTMEACSRGVSDMKGTSIGLTLGVFGDREANPYIAREIKNATLFERLANFVTLADAFIVLKGRVGTLAELFVIWNLKQTGAMGPRPLVLLGDCWPTILESLSRCTDIRDKDLRRLHVVSSPEEAVKTVNHFLNFKS